MNRENAVYYATLAVGMLSAGILIMVGARYILPVLAPFLIAWLMAMATRNPAEKLSGKIKIPEKIIRLLLSIFLTLSIFVAAGIIIWQITGALWSFLSDIGEGSKLYRLLNRLTSPTVSSEITGMSEEMLGYIGELLSELLKTALTWLGGIVTDVVSAVPKAFFFLVVTIISLIYFSLDLENINRLVKWILPHRVSAFLSSVRDGIFFVVKKYIRSYLLLMAITYTTIFAGLALLGIEHAALIAVIVALLDLLPVIGVGTLLIPWSVIEIATDNKFVGIGLLILFVVHTVIRQLAEPKIVGKSLDLHPIVTLILLYVGYALFGIAGLILLPVLAVSVTVALRGDKTTEIS